MHFENLFAAFHIGTVNGNLPVETSRAQLSTIEYIRTVSSSENNDAGIAAEAVHLN